MKTPPRDCILANARVVLADRILEQGWLAVANGLIAEVGEGDAPERGEDLAGDFLMPGLYEAPFVKNFFGPRPKSS
jgi:alpha-D-ribose 1-methylphosphonate 5-triphosphate diphosphatase